MQVPQAWETKWALESPISSWDVNDAKVPWAGVASARLDRSDIGFLRVQNRRSSQRSPGTEIEKVECKGLPVMLRFSVSVAGELISYGPVRST